VRDAPEKDDRREPSAHISQRRRRAAKPFAAHQIETLLHERVRSVAAGSAVIAIEAEFAGYFNNLGFRLDLASTASDAEAIDLSNKILAELTSATSDLEMPSSCASASTDPTSCCRRSTPTACRSGSAMAARPLTSPTPLRARSAACLIPERRKWNHLQRK